MEVDENTTSSLALRDLEQDWAKSTPIVGAMCTKPKAKNQKLRTEN
jgi:hypothetical protein